MKTHPFRGKLRPVSEIAGIIGKTTAFVDSCINSGKPLPRSKSKAGK